MEAIVTQVLNIVGLVVFYYLGQDAGYKEALRELTTGKMHISIFPKDESGRITREIELNKSVPEDKNV